MIIRVLNRKNRYFFYFLEIIDRKQKKCSVSMFLSPDISMNLISKTVYLIVVP